MQWKAEADCNTSVSRRHLSQKKLFPGRKFEGKKKKKKFCSTFSLEIKIKDGVPKRTCSKNVVKEVEKAS